ncbi:hypothetical protein MMMDOFMJ_0137 [Methylobacterium gnaphalii]|nr:hypothetical protein MMMDOFMJ_0137 [Methylobacterium gnaphalii]
MRAMETFAQIIAAIGYVRLSTLTGRPVGTVSSWQSRDVLPPEYWSVTVREAEERGLAGITHQVLADIAARNARRRRTSEAA